MIKYKRKKSATFEDTPIKKKYQTLQNEIQIFISLLKIDEPLFINTFDNNTRWLYLTDVNISHNDIDLLPRKLGTLHLCRLDVSHNCLKWRYGWGWLKEARIKKTLRFLDISNNSMFELSEYIWNLTALEELNISHNFLGYLPQGIEKVRNLRTLDLSHNLLKYLPIGIVILELQTINISMNPLVSDIEEDWEMIVFPTLTQFAANTLYQYCKDRHVIFQWDKMNEFINRNIINNCCLCGNICSIPYFYGATSTNYLPSIAANVITHTAEMSTITYKRKSSEDLPIEKKRHILEKEIKFFISLLKFGKSLFMTFNDNTWWLNLTNVNISNNNIDLLPRKLGALHCLRRLDVSHNCLKWRYGWGWLKEARIKKTLRFLDISNNSLFQLSQYIWNLTGLRKLNVSHNFLRHIPQGIEKVRKLKTLDLSHNLLKYLPVDIIMIKLRTIDISMNPLVTSDIQEDWEKIMFPTLTQFAANALYQYYKDIDVRFEWHAINDIDEIINKNIIDICVFCGKICSLPYYYGACGYSFIDSLAANVISHTEISTLWYEFYHCYHQCEVRPRVSKYIRQV